MQIEARYRIEECAADDDGRPVLEYVQVTTWQGKPVAVAADGYCLAVVPITLDDDDVPGPVHRSIFDAIAAEYEGHRDLRMLPPTSLLLGDATVTFGDGWTAPRRQRGYSTELIYPSWEKIVEGLTVSDGTIEFAVDSAKLARVQNALGSPWVVIRPGKTAASPILLAERPVEDGLEPPFAVLMPMSVNRLKQHAPKLKPEAVA